MLINDNGWVRPSTGHVFVVEYPSSDRYTFQHVGHVAFIYIILPIWQYIWLLKYTTISLIILVNSHHKQTTSNDQRELRFSLHSRTGTLVYTPSVFLLLWKSWRDYTNRTCSGFKRARPCDYHLLNLHLPGCQTALRR